MLLTIVTYGCKVPAGIFVPSMAAGATFGRALGIIVDLVYANHKDSLCLETVQRWQVYQPGLCSFGSRSWVMWHYGFTVTVVIIMFELTGALRYIIPTMIVVAITKSINDK